MQLTSTQALSQPEFFSLRKAEDRARLEKLFVTNRVQHVVNEYQSQLSELYVIEHPQHAFSPELPNLIREHLESLETSAPLEEHGTWVYFPWSSTLIHILDDALFQKVRTARNKLLISRDEQEAFYKSTIGIAGLSVGNSVALAIVLQGGARHLKLADHDSLELTNLNRIRAGVDSLGVPKVEMTARQIYALNPYAEIELYPQGLTDGSIEPFFEGLDMVIDEIDNLAVKYRIREYAKKLQIPVLMAADNDRMGVIDIERYDADQNLAFFHGRLQGETYDSLLKLDKRGIGRAIARLVGLENHTPRMLASLLEMGKSIVSWPQIGGTALLNGSFLAHAALRIANAQSVTSGRVVVGVDALLEDDYWSDERKKEREDAIGQFKNVLGL